MWSELALVVGIIITVAMAIFIGLFVGYSLVLLTINAWLIFDYCITKISNLLYYLFTLAVRYLSVIP
jgi:hypothetical protein